VPSVIKAIIEAKRSHTHAMGLKTVLIGRDPSNVEALCASMWARISG
jgi:L-rhamnonate dehydratase